MFEIIDYTYNTTLSAFLELYSTFLDNKDTVSTLLIRNFDIQLN